MFNAEGDPAGRPYSGVGDDRTDARPLGAIVGQFKSAATKRISALRGSASTYVWQRSYYEHVVRNEDELARVREYILNNPVKWALDEYNPQAASTRI